MKKLLVVVLLLSFALVSFAGCACDEDAPPTPPDQVDGPSEVIENGPVDPPDEPEVLVGGRIHEARDFGGRTIRVGAWWDEAIDTIAWGDEPDRATAVNYIVDRMVWDNARRVEEAFNVNFEMVIVSYEDFLPTLTASVMAGEPFADIIMLSGWMQMDSMGSIIQPWSNANLPNSDVLGAQIYAGPTTQNDQGVWAIMPHSVEAEAFGLAVNLDIVNADGLPNPIDLFESGQWTWDAMLDLMRRATRDTTGSGTIDQFGIGGQPGDIIQHLIGANDGMMVDGDFNYGFDHPNTIRTLEFAQQIFGERLWYVAADGFDTGNWNRNFYGPHETGNALLFPAVTWSLGNSPPPFNFGFVPFPTGPDNTTGSTWLTGIDQGICLAVGSEWDPADILMIMEEIFSWSGDEPDLMFVAGQIDWMREHFRTEDDVQRAIHSGITAASDIGRSVSQYYWVLGSFAEAFWNQEMDVLQAVEYHRGPQQEMLDMRFR
ncbi:MAG: ABC transporter substrate-binding protein [Defluviitaleaceae bacterium]|nr:ABC transporter substrate-binding protein [Defluviitaleaceae bacterium]